MEICRGTTGHDGPLWVRRGEYSTDEVWAQVLGSNDAGSPSLNVSTTNGFTTNDLVLMITVQDSNTNLAQNSAGSYEFGRIASLASNNITLTQPRSHTFTVSTNSERIQVLKVPEYTDVTLADAALSFDGTNDYMVVRHTDDLNAFPRTVSMWINTTNRGTGGVVNKYLSGSYNGYMVHMSLGHVRAWYFNSISNYVWSSDLGGLDGGDVADGTWHHVAFTVGTNMGRLYVDGALQSWTNWTGTAGPPTTTTDLHLGRYPDPDGTDVFFQGLMDDVRIWKAERTAEQILDDMRRELTGDEEGLVAYWRFNEATGTVAHDASPNHFDGTLTNGPTWVPCGSLSCHPWNGTNGGVLAFLARSISLAGNHVISADGKGYRGGPGAPSLAYDFAWGFAGERTTGVSTNRETGNLEKPQGGGGASHGAGSGGGGGGYGSDGGNGQIGTALGLPGHGATRSGTNTLSRLHLGGGGGGSGSHSLGREGVGGGAGGGIVLIAAGSIQGSGTISSRGAPGAAGIYEATTWGGSGGGGGAGGSIYLSGTLTNALQILASAGAAGLRHTNSANGANGGPGGVGRVRLDVPASSPAPGSVFPAPGYRAQLSASNSITSLFWGDYLDTDNDGLDDWQEFLQGTNPNNSDSGGDGMPDGWEVAQGFNPTNAVNAAQDSDNDGVANVVQFQRGTNPNNSDTDGDGLSDYQELFVYHTDPRSSNGLPSATGHRYYYDPLDRLLGVDYTNGLSLLYAYDGNNNLLRQAYLSAGDANSNSVSDLWEQLYGLTNGIFADTDGDGAPDGQEWWAGTDPTNTTRVPFDPLGTPGSNITAGIVFPFTPSNYLLAVGQLDGFGAEEIVVSADGNPGTNNNFLLILSQTSAGWTTQRVDLGAQGVTSVAIGQPANRDLPALYAGPYMPGCGRQAEPAVSSRSPAPAASGP